MVPAFVTFGRVLLALLFIVTGAMKLLDLSAAMMLTQKVVLPPLAAPYVAQLEAISGMPMQQLLAIGAGVLELISGLLVAFNVAARFFSAVLIVFVIASSYFLHDFWNQAGVEATANVMQVLKNTALIGGLFMVIGTGRGRRQTDSVYGDA